jgi:hypothetical protein
LLFVPSNFSKLVARLYEPGPGVVNLDCDVTIAVFIPILDKEVTYITRIYVIDGPLYLSFGVYLVGSGNSADFFSTLLSYLGKENFEPVCFPVPPLV